MSHTKIYDVAVVGAGVFGAWTALHSAGRGRRVLLIDPHGAGHSRSSSGDESRIIRMGYGADEIYTRWSKQSLLQWKELFAAAQRARLFQQTGVLWLAETGNPQLQATKDVLDRNEVAMEVFGREELAARYPQINLDGVGQGIYEPESGALLARRAVDVTAKEAVRIGADFKLAKILEPRGSGELDMITGAAGEKLVARQFVFACGAWLATLFPEILGDKIFPTRQSVFYFANPAGDSQFAPPALPTWLIKNDECYGIPDLESRGLKIAVDRHGERVDPETQPRIVTREEADEIRQYLGYRFPALKNAPIVETRVCQYENTSSGDFLIDRHPRLSNVWFVGGGSGHGFKHGPAVGEYVTRLLLGEVDEEPRFSLAGKAAVQNRVVY